VSDDPVATAPGTDSVAAARGYKYLGPPALVDQVIWSAPAERSVDGALDEP